MCLTQDLSLPVDPLMRLGGGRRGGMCKGKAEGLKSDKPGFKFQGLHLALPLPNL